MLEEQRDLFYQNIRTMIMVAYGYNDQDLGDFSTLNFVNREANRIFEMIFGEEY